MCAVLEIRNLSKTYRGREGEVRALDGINLKAEAGEFVAVQGPSGCGKTTLLLSAGGLLSPDEGEVLIEEENPYQAPPNERAKFRAQKLGFVFQQFHLIPYLTVLENVLAPSLACERPDARARAEELIGHFRLTHRAGHVPSELSTGERQRTALARALLNEPKLILADEPTGNLDRENAETVLKYLEEFIGNGGAVLLVTHDEYSASYASRRIFLKEGRMSEMDA